MGLYYDTKAVLEKVIEKEASIIGHVEGSLHPYSGELLQGTTFSSHYEGHPNVPEGDVLVGVAYNSSYAVAPDLTGAGRYWEVLEIPELPTSGFRWTGAILVQMSTETAKQCNSPGNRLGIEDLVTILEDFGYFPRH